MLDKAGGVIYGGLHMDGMSFWLEFWCIEHFEVQLVPPVMGAESLQCPTMPVGFP